MRTRGSTWRTPARSFNEAAGADPADARETRLSLTPSPSCFNEAAGADPADATDAPGSRTIASTASMRPRGQTPRMPDVARDQDALLLRLQ